MKIERILDDLHARLTASKFLQIFTAMTRVLLFIGFTPPSIKKILNEPFTILPDTNPIGHYFNALYQTGFYYQFLGWAQLTAAVLLLFPRTAHLGALMFLPIIANIAILTASVGFQGTWLVTALMTFAAMYLIAWDYDRLKLIFFTRRRENAHFMKLEYVWLPALFAVGGALITIVWRLMRLGNFPDYFKIGLILTVGGLVFGAIVALHHRFMQIGALENSVEMR